MRMRMWAGLGVMAVGLMLAAPAEAQRSGTGSTPTPSPAPVPPSQNPGSTRSVFGDTPMTIEGADPMRERMEAERLKAQNDDRHKRLVADAAKLLALATDLKADVDKTDKNQLSVTVVKKAAEMEKLARDLKDRMRE